MKIHKKILAGTGFLLLLVVSFFALQGKTLAVASAADAQKCVQTLKFISFAQIQCQTTQGPVNFYDKNPTDGTFNFDYSQDTSNIFCLNIPERGEVKLTRGISRESGRPDIDDKSIGVTVNLGITTNGTDCDRWDGPGGDDGAGATITDTQGLLFLYQFQGTSIGPLDAVSEGSLSKGSWGLAWGQKSNIGPDLLVFVSGDYRNCDGTIITVRTSGGANSAIAKIFFLEKDSGGYEVNSFTADLKTFQDKANFQGCGLANGDLYKFDVEIPPPASTFRILGTPPKVPADDEVVDPIATGQDTPSCEKNFSSVFTYFLCPALDLADSAAGALFGFVENQLCFNTGGSATGGVECEGDVILTDQVKASWSAFRVIATALLVIIMLVMVISQAFSVGPFDPYTVRRLLPRILAAVILIQLSWVMLKFFIDVSNDVGSGIAELMFAPFGGIENMRLDDLAGKAIGEAAGTTTNADVFAFFAVIAAVAVGIANLPGLFALAFFAVVGLFIAFAVLIIRKLLIILLVLLAPLALIAWILPAGESYWKTWKDNFSKLLLMFPMIMAMIAAGRIMAFVASQSAIMFPPRLAVAEIGPLPVPYFADAKAFVSLAIIIIAFFAPYFLILKTFSWAGSLMRVVASGATNNRMMRNLQEKGGERVGGLTERLVTGRYAKKYDPNQGRLRRTGYSIMGGRLIPTKYRQAVLTQRGDKWAEQRNAEAGSYVGRGYEKALAGYDIYDMSDGKFGRFSRHTGAEKVDANGRTVREGDLLDAYGNKASKLTAQFTETTKSDAYKERVTGVEAGKQFLVDSAGLEGDDAQARRAMAAHKLLLDTRSEIELQGSYIQSGKHEGKRTVEVPTWDITLAASPPHYAATTRSRPDFAPDVKQSAESRTSQRLGRQVSYADVPATDTATRRELDKDRLRIALERLSPESLQNAHYGFFDDITRLNDKELSTMFASTLENFWINAGQPGNVAVGSLRGAKESHVNDALAQAGNSLDQITRGRSTPPASSGEVRIDH